LRAAYRAMKGEIIKAADATVFRPMTISDSDFKRMINFMHDKYGIDLSQKKQLVSARLSPAIRKLGYHGFTDFIDHVLKTKDNEEITLILNRLTTNYTFFMREKEHLDYFCNNIIPDIIKRHQRDKILSIWSAGCSSGEEPYNISMFLFDYLGEAAKEWDTRILATDISEQSLAKARRGIYDLPETVPQEWVQKYFIPAHDGRFMVNPQVKNNVIFQHFNLMDPIRFKRKFDVIFCRNVMIYFDQVTRDALVHRFYDATLPGGYLLVSYSENLGNKVPYRRLDTATFQK
jgi:chemotaxis protein methyltransferase CheR